MDAKGAKQSVCINEKSVIKEKIHLLFDEKLEKYEQDINSVKLNLSNVQIAIIP